MPLNFIEILTHLLSTTAVTFTPHSAVTFTSHSAVTFTPHSSSRVLETVLEMGVDDTGVLIS